MEKLFYTKHDLFRRGWSSRMIKKLIDFEPEHKPNPVFVNGADMLLYPITSIHNIENTDVFKKESQKANKRSLIAKRRSIQKKEINLERMKLHLTSITVKKIKGVRQKAIKYKKSTLNNFDLLVFNPENECEEEIDRWTVNYIRHNLTKYDDCLRDIYRKVGHDEIYLLIFNTIMDKIAEIYPEYKKQCELQKERKKYCFEQKSMTRW